MTLLPNIAALTAFGSAFGIGWLMHRQVQLLNVLEARWPLNLTIAVVATVACLAHVGVIASIDVASRDLADPRLCSELCAGGLVLELRADWSRVAIPRGL